MAKRLVVIVPAYNEEEILEQTIGALRSIDDALRQLDIAMHICLIDDGSTDSTRSVAQRCDIDHIIGHKVNQGLGAAVRSGIEYARVEGFDFLVKFDADLQHDPNDIPALLKPLSDDQADVVYGNRFPHIAYRMPWMRRWGNWLFTRLMRALTGWPVQDSQPGIFAVNQDYLAQADVPSDYNYTQMVLLDAYLKNMRFTQVDVHFRKRVSGQSFVSLRYPFKVIPQILLLVASAKPMSIFAPIGLTFLLVGGTVFGVQFVMWLLGETPKPVVNVNLVLGSLLFGLQTLFFGILAELIVRKK